MNQPTTCPYALTSIERWHLIRSGSIGVKKESTPAQKRRKRKHDKPGRPPVIKAAIRRYAAKHPEQEFTASAFRMDRDTTTRTLRKMAAAGELEVIQSGHGKHAIPTYKKLNLKNEHVQSQSNMGEPGSPRSEEGL